MNKIEQTLSVLLEDDYFVKLLKYTLTQYRKDCEKSLEAARKLQPPNFQKAIEDDFKSKELDFKLSDKVIIDAYSKMVESHFKRVIRDYEKYIRVSDQVIEHIHSK